MGSILQALGQLLSPIGTLFHYVFYLPIFNVLMLLYEGVHAIAPGFPAFAIAILLLTVIIRLCLFPLTRKQLQSSRAMQVLAPQVKELQQRYKNDPQGLMAAQRELYREHGVSMYGGCLPLVIQMPFLYGLYYSLFTALGGRTVSHLTPAVENAKRLTAINHDIYAFLPHLTLHTLPSTIFLWTNLANVDPLKILPVLAGLLTFLQLRMAQPVKRPTPPGQQPDTTTQAMSSMMFVMPFITFFMALNFPSGLAFYWAISTAFSAVQQYFLTGFGSLFYGIPGLEHLVPAPQPAPALPAPAGRRALPAPAARGLVDTSAPRIPRLLGEAGDRLRKLLVPPPASAAPDRSEPRANGATQPRRAPATGQSAAARSPIAPNGTANGGRGERRAPPATPASGDTMPRRPRPERQGPMLVKPRAPAAPASDGTTPLASGAFAGHAGGAPAAPATNGSHPHGAGRPAAQNGRPVAPPARRPAGASAARRQGGGSQAARRRSGGKAKGGR